jgi:hypothetical protein
VSDSARGSLVLGTNSALLTGHLNTVRLERSVSFKMDQVQAHVVCSEAEPQRGPMWLQIANGKLMTPPGAEAVMRQVLLPFRVRLASVAACGGRVPQSCASALVRVLSVLTLVCGSTAYSCIAVKLTCKLQPSTSSR